MDGIDREAIAGIVKSSPSEVKSIIKQESSQLEVTKSLLNILHNLIRVGSIPVEDYKRSFFDSHSELILDLLSSKRSLKWKKGTFERNPIVVINIATSWPTVDL
jgi:hypothetical protein